MANQEDIATSLAVHEAVCVERWKQTLAWLRRIEAVLGAIVLLLLLGEGSVVSVINRLPGGGWCSAMSRFGRSATHIARSFSVLRPRRVNGGGVFDVRPISKPVCAALPEPGMQRYITLIPQL